MDPERDRREESAAPPARDDVGGAIGEDATTLAFSGWSATDAALGLVRRLERNDPEAKKLALYNRDMNSAQSRILGRILGRNTHVTQLIFHGCSLDVTELCGGLQDNRSIETLSFRGFDLDANKMNSLATVLTNTPVQSLSLAYWSIGQAGISTLSAALPDRLHTLNLTGNPLGNDGLDQLLRVLRSGHTRLKYLSMKDCGIGLAGCIALATLLGQEGSSLLYLSLRGNHLDDECVLHLARSLEGKRELGCLHLDDNRGITAQGWKTLLDLVCDSTSIDSVEVSNHTLRALADDKGQLMLEAHDRNLLWASLKLNRTYDKKAVVRQKLLWSHLKGDLNAGESAVVAHALLPDLTRAVDEDAERLLQSFRHDSPLPAPAFEATRLGAVFRILRSRPEWCLRRR